MTTIGQRLGQADYTTSDACFGACLGYLGQRWDQVEIGQLVLPCETDPPSGAQLECTIAFEANNSWFGGMQYFPDQAVAQSAQQFSGSTPNYDEEGIDLQQDDINYNGVKLAKDVARAPDSGVYMPTPSPVPAARPTPAPCKAPPGCATCPQDAPGASFPELQPGYGNLGSGINPNVACPQVGKN